MLIGIIVFTSCNNDDDHPWNNYYLSVGTVTKDADSFYINTDKGSVLKPVYSSANPNHLEEGMRVYVEFSIVEEQDSSDAYDYAIDIYDIDEILTKSVFQFDTETPKEVKDSIGNDRIQIASSWMSNDYLNVEFQYSGGARVHYINLVYDTENPTTDTGEVILELKHNDNNDPYNKRLLGLASFNVSSFKEDGKEPIDFLLRTKGVNGKYHYNKVLTYSFKGDSENESGKGLWTDSNGFEIGELE